MFTTNNNIKTSVVTNKQLEQFENLLAIVQNGSILDFQNAMVDAHAKIGIKYGDTEACQAAASMIGEFKLKIGEEQYKGYEVTTIDAANLEEVKNRVQETVAASTDTQPATFLALTAYTAQALASGTTSINIVAPCLTDASGAFAGLSSLTTVKLDTPNLTKCTNMFNGCTSLQNWDGCLDNVTFENGLANLFADAKLTTESVINVAKAVKDIKPIYDPNFTPKTINIGVGAALSSADKESVESIFSKKGYSVTFAVKS